MANDPESVKFRAIDVYKNTSQPGSALFIACGSFNATNGFRGYGGFCRFIFGGNEAEMIMEEANTPAAFAKAWREGCSGPSLAHSNGDSNVI